MVTIDDVLSLDDVLAVRLQVAAVHCGAPRVRFEVFALQLDVLQDGGVVLVSCAGRVRQHGGQTLTQPTVSTDDTFISQRLDGHGSGPEAEGVCGLGQNPAQAQRTVIIQVPTKAETSPL